MFGAGCMIQKFVWIFIKEKFPFPNCGHVHWLSSLRADELCSKTDLSIGYSISVPSDIMWLAEKSVLHFYVFRRWQRRHISPFLRYLQSIQQLENVLGGFTVKFWWSSFFYFLDWTSESWDKLIPVRRQSDEWWWCWSSLLISPENGSFR